MTNLTPLPCGPAPGDAVFTPDGLWASISAHAQRADKPVAGLFLDRDGVINVDAHYLGRVEDVRLLDGAAQMIRRANQAHVPVIVVTNQSGIGRGYFDWDNFAAVQGEIMSQLNEHGAHWDAAYACAFHRDAKPPYDQDNHPARKPNPGMILRGADDLNIDLETSWIIGDKAGDLRAGKNAGLYGGIHVATHPEKAEAEAIRAHELMSEAFQVISTADVAAAMHRLPLINKT